MKNFPYFIKSAYFKKDYPRHEGVEFAFLGASNSGKSSLVNAILKKELCKTSSKPGHTSIINFFQWEKSLVLVDLPGYGFARRSNKEQEKWRRSIEEYLTHRDQLKLCFVLFDLKRGLLDNDLNLLEWLAQLELSVILVATKADKLNQKERSAKLKKLKEVTGPIDVLVTSSHKKQGLEKLSQIMHFDADV
jgi:GTP-binding protein